MYTQCPHCQTIFGVSEAHLSAAFGRVRCGHCHGQFNAKRHLLDEIPDLPAEETAAPVQGDAEPVINIEESTDGESSGFEYSLSDDIPDEEIDYIDLSSPVDETDTAPAEEALIDLDEAVSQDDDDFLNITNDSENEELPVVEDSANRAELDAIFADLDQRLEQLSEDSNEGVIKPNEEFELGEARQETFNDAFGDPDSQTEDDIKASIETIFAAAEAELIKTDTDENADLAEEEIPLSEFLDNASLELPDIQAVDTSDADEEFAVVETGAVNVTDNETDETNDTENFALRLEESASTESSASGEYEGTSTNEQADKAPAYEQEELPFVLHDDIHTEVTAPRSHKQTAALSLLILLLLTAFTFQLALFRNIELANYFPPLKPYLVSFCQKMPCQFSGKRDVKQIQLTSRDVRTHPKGKNTILINAIFVNQAGFEQPYPDILITLSDLTTTVVSQRRFTPDDYLANQQGGFQLMKPGKPVHISLEVLDPGNDAVNFQFEFL